MPNIEIMLESARNSIDRAVEACSENKKEEVLKELGYISARLDDIERKNKECEK